MFIIYDGSPWERQFLLSDLLPNYPIIYCKFSDYPNNEYWKSKYGNYNLQNNNILIFSSNFNSYDTIHSFVMYLNPKIVIHLSDEWGNKPEYQNLTNYTQLILRQHYHYKYPHYKNIRYIPLGYMDGMVEKNYRDIPLKEPIKRKYVWSFVGNMKKDRQEMISTFLDLKPNYYGLAKVEDLKKIYRESIFVPNGRGEVSLDCFRLYEASICGAIPIIVGKKDEIDNTFPYEEHPPWLFYETWIEAKEECMKLLKDMTMITIMSKKLSTWWNNRIDRIKKVIKIICQ